MRRVDESEWVEIDPDQINNRPNLMNYDIDTSLKTVGHDYLVRMKVQNRVGEAVSDSSVFLLADVPDAPGMPTRESDGTTMRIFIAPPADDGGAQIRSYQLQIMLPHDHDWRTVMGLTGLNLETTFDVTNKDLLPS